MILTELISSVSDLAASGPLDVEVRGLAYDSRRVQPGFLYCALKGGKADGAHFVDDAIAAGAVGVLSEGKPDRAGVAWLQARDPRRAMAALAAAYHGHPSRSLRVAGVTGTNGKTTTAFLIHHLLKASRGRAGLIGTVHYDDGQTQRPASHTTPESIDLQEWLARMVAHGCEGVAMEVSSHALVQRRTDGIAFDTAIFTNLTQDHLDFHRTMDEYFEAKALLFEQMAGQPEKKPVAVINADDPAGRKLIARLGTRVRVVRYGLGAAADYRATNVRFDATGTRYQLEVGERKLLVRLPLIGRFNVMNSLAALAGATACGLNLREAVANLAQAPQVPGRLENVAGKRGFRVFVDYSHTPDALENALVTLRELAPHRLLVAFGCGGDRDSGKRPLMGAVAARLADFTVLTSDNPRSEDPVAILNEIKAGFGSAAGEVIVDRRQAIGRAIELAQEGDIVVIAGKGHEDYQILGDRTIAFDDRQVARRFIEEKPSVPRPDSMSRGTRPPPLGGRRFP
ncbi:MAG: UDP-N-acetylmuramoyl-L-alanyl-D-glutamate--2,6-diaminopimelate ligase [Verrucomicrobiales bacterium]